MPNPQIDKVNVNGTTYDIVDTTSGYTTNTGTITSVKTTAGTHTTINVSSGAANFNVPTKTSHLTNDSGFLTSYTETDPVFSASAAAGITSSDITNWNSKTSNTGTVTSVRVQATSPVQSSTNTEQTTSLNTTISLADAYGDTKNPYGSKTKNYVLAAPSNAAGTPSFRALVADDIPDLSGTYLTSYTETDPTVPSWAKQSTKPSYTASEVGAVATSAVGAASGVVPLNASSKIDSTYLPSYVDDVIEGYYYNNKFWKEGSHTTEITGEAGKIYVDLSTDKTYRYSGTAFVEISKGGSVVTVSRDLITGTKVGVISVDGTTYQLYAPTPASTTQNAETGISIAAHGTGTVTGVQSTTTTASKVTLGTAFSVPNVTSAGSASTWTFEEKTIPNVTAAGSGSASLTMTMDTTDTKKLNITFSHTHTAPTLGTAIKVQSKSGGANGSAPILGTAFSIPNVTGATDVTVPIKNTSASTFVTGTTHTITDNGHTHSI